MGAYASEVRFGVVMYGGVSLAIYINGVANELYEMCCATPKVEGEPPPPGSTREVYRKLSWLLHNPRLRDDWLRHLDDPAKPDPFANGGPAAAPGLERVRLVVDVVAGTSAGGINGVFLAKALANGEAFSPLKKLWVQEGDIAALLNDRRSWQGIEFAKRSGESAAAKSLLNSDRMYLKLFEAMQAMSDGGRAMPPIGSGESALSDEIDLYVTTTDIRGAVVPLRLFDKVVHEKRHKQVYHFQYAGAAGQALRNDFVAGNNPFLAFAARCTSSFPFAFEPMQVADAERLNLARPGGGAVDFGAWKGFFTGFSADDMASGRWRTRAFGDGGYLDNKPFSYVVQALSWRLAALPIERKLIYVEPAPAHPERERQQFGADEKPDAIENAVAALTHIPQYETIREDLQAVLERNRRIERVERIVRRVEHDVEMAGDEPFARVLTQKGEVRDWSTLDLGDMIAYYGVAFLPYRRLRITTVSDDLADRMAQRWGVDRRSDRLYAMRALVRAWREENYFEHRGEKTPTQAKAINAFLAEYDQQYRLRRAAFLLRKTHQLLRVVALLGAPQAGASDTERALLARLRRHEPRLDTLAPAALAAALEHLRDGFAAAVSALRASAWPGDAGTASAEERALLHRLLGLLIGERSDEPLTALESLTGDPVPVDLGHLELPSPLRTLQENVFKRARGLYEIARAGRRTKMQERLEADIAAIGADYARATGTLSVRELLGQPKLAVQARDGRQRVAVEVGDTQAAVLDTAEGRMLRAFIAEYYLRFDEFDQVSFPLYYDTDTGEPSTVEVVRISPEDATSLVDENKEPRRKLAGTQLFNFGGFLDAQWRRNDIMWGRLDGCERLLATLLPADERLRGALLEQAQRAILREEMSQPAYNELVRRFADTLLAQGQPTLQQAFGAVWAGLGQNDVQRSTRTAMALKAVLGDAGLLDYVKQHYEVDRSLDPEGAMKTASRAVTITGEVLEGIEKRHQRKGSRAVWLARGGRAVQGLLAVATPGSLARKLWSHWLALLYLFEAATFGGAVLFSAEVVRNFALAAFALTLALHLATLITGDLMRRRFGWLRWTAAVFVLVLLLLAGFGGVGLWSLGPEKLLCGEAPPSGTTGWFCRR